MKNLTKAETLRFLKDRLKKSFIEEIYTFTTHNWKNNPSKILQEVQKRFGGKIIIRSSAINEDTNDNSMAGYFDSILNIDSQNSKEIADAIEKVINSYNSKNSGSASNQILVQSQSKDIVLSGVVFTRGLENNAPFYIINYDNTSGSTEAVTAGIENKSIKIFRDSKFPLPEKFKSLINSVDEIEKLFQSDSLDIEFAINHQGQVIIFQVRPITLLRSKIEETLVSKKINLLKKKFNSLTKPIINLCGKNTIFADMPDWNPAEIIGDHPGFLDYSLYNYIITKKSWSEARASQGYYNLNDTKLIYLFGNKPYVDVRKSFNSFTPQKISEPLRKKLVQFYLEKLKRNPELQDKVEFDILFTCYDFLIDKRFEELKKEGFTNQELEELKNALLELTNNLILDSKTSISRDIDSSRNLETVRNSIRIDSNKDIVNESRKYAKLLLDECIEKGTREFSRLARLGFIGKIFLKSLSEKGILPKEDFENFYESLNTIATIFTRDFNQFLSGKISQRDFIKKYSHLRPGTYDITSKRYGDNPSLLNPEENISPHKSKKTKFKMPKKILKNIDEELKKEGLKFNAKELFDFAKSATEAREFSKFEFTKNLSDAMELIVIAGQEMGFSREEMSYLAVEDIFINIVDRDNLAEYWIEKITARTKEREINEKLYLPPIIFSEKDFEIVFDYSSKPNYITRKKIKAKTISIKESSLKNINLSGKIILIENGDPGYDWIFTKNIAGLVTKYGGVASHMSIRCAEFGIPAAIGCGGRYDRIKSNKTITLDCKKKIIHG